MGVKTLATWEISATKPTEKGALIWSNLFC